MADDGGSKRNSERARALEEETRQQAQSARKRAEEARDRFDEAAREFLGGIDDLDADTGIHELAALLGEEPPTPKAPPDKSIHEIDTEPSPFRAVSDDDVGPLSERAPHAPKQTVEMPAAQQRELADKSRPPEVVLVVDDDYDICDVLRQILEEDAEPPYRVELAHNGLEAVTTLHRLRSEGTLPVCVLLDLMMPEYSGWTYLGFAERCWMLEVPFRLISAMSLPASGGADDTRQIFLNRYRDGGNEVVRKPFRGPDQILRVVRSAAAERNARLPPY